MTDPSLLDETSHQAPAELPGAGLAAGVLPAGMIDPILFLTPAHPASAQWREQIPFAFWLVARQRPDSIVDLAGPGSFLAFCQAVSHLGAATRCSGFGDGPDGLADPYPGVGQLRTNAPTAAEFADGSVDLLNLPCGSDDPTGLLADWLPKLSDRAVVLLAAPDSAMVADLTQRYPSFAFEHGAGLLVAGVGADQPADLRAVFDADEAARTAIRQVFARLGKACTADALGAEIDSLTADLQRAGLDLADRDRRVQLLARDLRSSGDKLRSQRQKLSELARTVARQERALVRAKKQTDAAKRQLRDLRRSVSWRLTAPLRLATRALRRGRKLLRDLRGGQPAATPTAPTASRVASGPQVRVPRPSWDAATEQQVTKRLADLHDAHSHELGRCLVTVILPTLDQAGELGAAIETVRSQLHSNFELLVADAGSTDDTAAVVASFGDSRIRHLQLARQSLAEARNAGLVEARGEIVCHLDVQHHWQPTHLRHLVTFLLGTGATAAYSGLELEAGGKPSYQGSTFDYASLREADYLDLAAFGHRRLDHAIHRFAPELNGLADWDYLLTVTGIAGATYLPYLGARRLAGGAAAPAAEPEVQALLAKRHIVRTGKTVPADPGWAGQLADAAGLVGDAASLPFEAADAALDWPGLAQRQRVRGLVSVVVLAFNNYEFTRDCVESVLANPGSRPVELIVVDNGGTDDTLGRLAADFPDRPELKPVRSEQNLMFSAGNNLGFAHADGEFVVLLNNDTVVTPGWLDGLIEPLRYDATVGITGPKLLYADGTVQCCGLAFSGQSQIPYHLYRDHPGEAPEVNRPRVFQALTGACVALRAADYAAIRGLDPVFINGCEDLDLAFRLYRSHRLRALYVPGCEVYHLESRTPGRGAHIQRNRAGFVTRWGSQVRADDQVFYAEDGFEVVGYTRQPNEPEASTSIYLPTLKPVADEPAAAPERVNIGFVSIWHTRGVSILTKQLADAITSDTVRTHIFARTESERFENAGPVWHPSVFNAGDDPTSESMLAWVREHDIDCVVFVEVHPGDWKRAAALKAAGVKIVCYEHLDVMRVASAPRYAMFDDFLFASFTARDHLLRRFPDKRAILVPWATDLDVTPQPIGDDDSELRFVHVGGWGGINNRKNSDLVIRAFDAAGVPGATLELYTQVPIDRYGDDVAAICATNPQIIVTEGTVEDIGQAYRDKDVLLWPSKREGVGLPIIEALASGLTVIISDGYLMKQWVVPGVHGVTCPARPRYGIRELPELEVDEAGLVERIRALAGNRELVRELRTAVTRDRWLWVWGWQKAVLRQELVAMATRPHYRPSEALEYVPAEVLQFEADRLAAE